MFERNVETCFRWSISLNQVLSRKSFLFLFTMLFFDIRLRFKDHFLQLKIVICYFRFCLFKLLLYLCVEIGEDGFLMEII